jgi:hypothetical protein
MFQSQSGFRANMYSHFNSNFYKFALYLKLIDDLDKVK